MLPTKEQFGKKLRVKTKNHTKLVELYYDEKGWYLMPYTDELHKDQKHYIKDIEVEEILED